MKKILMVVIGIAIGVAGCGDSNWFKSFHKAGSSSDVASLLADADAALINKDFGAALNYYEQILDKDPTNSEALYGAAAAWLGSRGFDVASIITNILTNQDKMSSPVLPQLVSKAGGSVSRQSTGDLLPDTMNWKELLTAMFWARKYLRQIVAGNTDGVIPPDNTNVRVNLIICLVLHDVIRLVDYDNDGNIDDDPDDPITILNDYTIGYQYPNGLDPVYFTDADRDAIIGILEDFRDEILPEIDANFTAIIAAYKVDAGDTIAELKEDILTTFSTAIDNAIDELEDLS